MTLEEIYERIAIIKAVHSTGSYSAPGKAFGVPKEHELRAIWVALELERLYTDVGRAAYKLIGKVTA